VRSLFCREKGDHVFVERRAMAFYLRECDPEGDVGSAIALKFIQRIIGEYQLKLLIFNPDKEEIVTWRD
jgi:hypothetical protein